MKKAFTLIELLVVIAIIAILATILLPSLRKAQFLAKMSKCKSGLHNIGIAASLYANDSDAKYPVGAYHNLPTRGPIADFFGDQFKLVMDDIQVFRCPLAGDEHSPWQDYQSSYARGIFPFVPPFNWKAQTYLYFGNYSWDVKWHGINALFTTQDISEIDAGRLYPRNNTGPRAKLFQDTVSTHHEATTNHESPNSLFTDGSVEQGNEDPYSGLKAYARPHGVFWW